MRLRPNVLVILMLIFFFCISFIVANGLNFSNLKYSGNSITSDELPHLASGYYYLKTGRTFLNPEHPPLVKVIAALPLLIVNPELPEFIEGGSTSLPSYPYKQGVDFAKNLEIENWQWEFGKYFMFNQSNNPDLLLFLARTSVLFVNTVLIGVLYIYLRKLTSVKAALLSVFFISTANFLLAHASLITTDVMSALLQVISIAAYSIFLKKFLNKERYWQSFSISVVFFVLAQTAKFSSVVLFPVIVLFTVGYLWLNKYKKEDLIRTIKIFILWVIAVFVLIAIIFGMWALNSSPADLKLLISTNSSQIPGPIASVFNFFASDNIIFKGLFQYFYGIMLVFGRISQAYQDLYFMGNVYANEGSGVFYFPMVYITKISEGFLLLLFISIALVLTKLRNQRDVLVSNMNRIKSNAFLIYLGLFGLVYLLIALISDLQLGLRHITSVVVISFIFVAVIVSKLFQKSINFKRITFVSVILILLSVFLVLPYQFSYYNLLAGGIYNGQYIAVDSNYDWGQDLKRFGEWAKRNNVSEVYVNVFYYPPIEHYDVKVNQLDMKNLPPRGSYIVISMNEYQKSIYRENLSDQERYTNLEPYFIERIGTALLVFKIK
jgi:hypothetical protein